MEQATQDAVIVKKPEHFWWVLIDMKGTTASLQVFNLRSNVSTPGKRFASFTDTKECMFFCHELNLILGWNSDDIKTMTKQLSEQLNLDTYTID